MLGDLLRIFIRIQLVDYAREDGCSVRLDGDTNLNEHRHEGAQADAIPRKPSRSVTLSSTVLDRAAERHKG